MGALTRMMMVMGGLETVILCFMTTCNGNRRVMELIGVAIVDMAKWLSFALANPRGNGSVFEKF